MAKTKRKKPQEEHEATFLVEKLPKDYKDTRYKDIKQGYFSAGKDALRIRKKGDEYELTKKEEVEAGNLSKFNEHTIEIKKEEFERIWPTVKSSLEKRRYFYPLGDLIAEIDVFSDRLDGLILVEVEFPSPEAEKKFKKPNWVGRDVTQESWVYGGNLAGKTYQQIEKFLKN